MAENPLIPFILGLLVIFGLFLMFAAGQALVEATDNIWDDLVWSLSQYLLGEAVIFAVPIPFAGGIGVGLTGGGSIILVKMK
ncbi:MAG: hypothetical protein ACFE9L_19680 [Candidatus Hodarchaeota archaeon]